jgi:polyphosphate kinase 2 (PPK2 family)
MEHPERETWARLLHLSQRERRNRFLARIDTPDKSWKLSGADLKERGFWSQYMSVHEECLSATSADFAPWRLGLGQHLKGETDYGTRHTVA